MAPEEADALSKTLTAALQPALPALGQGGWELASVAPRLLMGTHMPVVAFRRASDTLCFIVTPTDPSKPAYKRTPRYDVVYFSEDVPDDQQSQIYRRDRELIDRFAAFLRAWDA